MIYLVSKNKTLFKSNLYETECTMSIDQTFSYPVATIEIMDEHRNILKDNYGGGQLRSDT